jgi:hypothetical protein
MPAKKLRNHTRRAKGGLTLSVEALQGSFSAIDAKVARAIARRATDRELVDVLQTAWHGQFRRPLSLAATRGLIEHYRAVHKEGGVSKRRTRKAARGQRGGMAPLDWTLGQGTTVPVYGSFPVEIGMSAAAVRSLDLGRFFESPISRACDTTGGADPLVGQKGGGVPDAIALGHVPSSVPANALQTAVAAIQGVPVDAYTGPMRSSVPLESMPVRPFDTSQIAPITSLAPVWSGGF